MENSKERQIKLCKKSDSCESSEIRKFRCCPIVIDKDKKKWNRRGNQGEVQRQGEMLWQRERTMEKEEADEGEKNKKKKQKKMEKQKNGKTQRWGLGVVGRG